jgi:acyl-CoA synthetase (NDP forming)
MLIASSLFYTLQITKQCVRGLMLHEYHGVKLLQNAQINVRPFEAAKTADEAFEQAKKIGELNSIRINESTIFSCE